MLTLSPSLPELDRLRAGLFQAQGRCPVALTVSAEILADLDTPVSAFLKVGDGPYSFLLESVEGGERWARYSYIGLDPAFVVRAHGRAVELLRDGAPPLRQEHPDPLQFLSQCLGRYHAPPPDRSAPARFRGGAVGWLGFDAIRFWERLPDPRPAPPDLPPVLTFAVPRTLLTFDNLRHRVSLAQVLLLEPEDDLAAAYAEAGRRVHAVLHRLRGPLPPPSAPRPEASPRLTQAGSRRDYEEAVLRIGRYIRAGDCIQVVPSQRFRLAYDGEAVDLYRALRAVNPSPYLFCLRYPELCVVGASPEVMVRVEDGVAVTAPIAGTRRRGGGEEEDRALAAELLADPKERAEHVMLVDLARNDLGRVAAPGSVQVRSFMKVQRFSHVMHIVSEVGARLQPGRTAYDAVRACFPAGTLSGAPKLRAIQIIDELEPAPREIYGGAVGYFDFAGDAELCIAIRTAWRKPSDGAWYLQVGSGIVADSDPGAEYEEILNKAGALLSAVELMRREGL
jgi:anthranilate synthase component 1